MRCRILLCLACALTMACHRSRPETISSSPPIASASSKPVSKAEPQPTEAELREAIERNYKDAVVMDHTQTVPFLIGDFNGDNSEDIVVVVKPGAGKLSELNSEYANWILEDPHYIQPQQKSRPVSVQRNDLLLAVIHGHEREGWRNSLATQTYLLKNAVGKELEKQQVRQTSSDGSRALHVFRGDVIREQLDGTTGIIYWTGAKYAWRATSRS